MSLKTANFTSGGIGGRPILGVTVEDPTTRGGGIHGIMPPQTLDDDRSFINWEQPRFTLREAWNTTYPGQLARAKISKPICTPFRAVTNSGDLLSRKSYSCGGPCQTFQSRPNLRGLSQHFGKIQSRCDGTGVPPASCNVKYVYDASNYITYKKQSAIAKNYNDISSGGDNSNASQSAIRAIRRF
jgi:hypothetical protein